MATLAYALPEFDAGYQALVQRLAQEGIRIAPTGEQGDTLRTQADTAQDLRWRDQDYAVYLGHLPAGAVPIPKERWRPIAPFGRSYHNYGAAVDTKIIAAPAGMTVGQAQQRVAVLAPQFGLRSGLSFGDPAHLELAVPLDEAKARWATLGGSAGVAPIAATMKATAPAFLVVALLGGVVWLLRRHAN